MSQIIPILFIVFFAASAAAQDLGFTEAGIHNGVNADMLAAISWNESRQNAAVAPAKNVRKSKKTGKVSVSYDHTHMQINDHYWRKEIDKIDPRLWDKMLKDPKLATIVGGWIYSQCVQRYGNTWHSVAAYNTGRKIDLLDCLNGIPAFREGKPITPEEYAEAVERVERGRAYARSAFDYLVQTGKISASAPIPQILLSQAEKAQMASQTRQALPMRQTTINVAAQRKRGKWRRVQ